MEDDSLDVPLSLFDEPENFYKPPPEPTFITYSRVSSQLHPIPKPRDLTVRLIGKSPLWGHLLWNAGKSTTNHLDANGDTLCKGKNVLELGAAAALPSFIAAINDAKKLVITDYPDPDLLENIKYNVNNCTALTDDMRSKMIIEGHIWGSEPEQLLRFINPDISNSSDFKIKFDLIILSDLIFNHTEHHKLLTTCKETIAPDGIIFAVFSPHRPKLIKKDFAFFEMAETEFNFKCDKIIEQKWSPMFDEDDPDTVEIRSMVYGYFLRPNW